MRSTCRRPFANFSTGNRFTLWDEPCASGTDVVGALRQLWERHYRGGGITVAVVAPQEPELLAAWVEGAFAGACLAAGLAGWVGGWAVGCLDGRRAGCSGGWLGEDWKGWLRCMLACIAISPLAQCTTNCPCVSAPAALAAGVRPDEAGSSGVEEAAGAAAAAIADAAAAGSPADGDAMQLSASADNGTQGGNGCSNGSSRPCRYNLDVAGDEQLGSYLEVSPMRPELRQLDLIWWVHLAGPLARLPLCARPCSNLWGGAAPEVVRAPPLVGRGGSSFKSGREPIHITLQTNMTLPGFPFFRRASPPPAACFRYIPHGSQRQRYTKPWAWVAHVLGHEAAGSAAELLKRQGLIQELSAGGAWGVGMGKGSVHLNRF